MFSSLGQLQSSSSHDFGVFQVIMVLKVASFSEIIMALNICKLCVHLLGAEFHYALEKYYILTCLPISKNLTKISLNIFIFDDFYARINFETTSIFQNSFWECFGFVRSKFHYVHHL